MIVKSAANSEAGRLPPGELPAATGESDRILADAGVLQPGEGPDRSAEGKRGNVDGGWRMFVNGPVAANDELVA